jgi:hypothetical protein
LLQSDDSCNLQVDRPTDINLLSSISVPQSPSANEILSYRNKFTRQLNCKLPSHSSTNSFELPLNELSLENNSNKLPKKVSSADSILAMFKNRSFSPLSTGVDVSGTNSSYSNTFHGEIESDVESDQSCSTFFSENEYYIESLRSDNALSDGAIKPQNLLQPPVILLNLDTNSKYCLSPIREMRETPTPTLLTPVHYSHSLHKLQNLQDIGDIFKNKQHEGIKIHSSVELGSIPKNRLIPKGSPPPKKGNCLDIEEILTFSFHQDEKVKTIPSITVSEADD